jgi:glycosyltransferase involved in cell wall biosynthesis
VTPLRITWVVPLLRFAGGIRVVFEHTRGLLERGHDVRIVVPRDPPGLARAREWVLEHWVTRSREVLAGYGFADRVIETRGLDPRDFPDADVTLATAHQNAAAVAAAPPRCGRRAYFLQGYEVFLPGLAESVDAGWRLPLERITIASWLSTLAREKFGVGTWGPVVNGVDFAQFHDRGRRENRPPVLGMMYETMPWKGIEDGFAAIAEARRALPEVPLRMYGRPRLRHPIARGDRYERNPTQARLAAFYRECDVFLSPSWTEGCQLPPMEAMASGCAVVATNVGGIPDYAIAGRTAIVAAPHDPAALAAGLVRLLADAGERRRMAQAGKEHIARFTWPAATAQLEAILLRIAAGESA